MPPQRSILLLAPMFGLLTLLPQAGMAALAGPVPWGTDGTVLAIARSGPTLYIGGSFNQVGPATGGGVPLDPCRGSVPEHFPRVAGSVYAVCSDGRGGWYIGGIFTAVEGAPRTNLAHVLADGRVSAWSPILNGYVDDILLIGDTVIVGGGFTTVNGTIRVAVAAIDRFGRPTPWDPELLGANNEVAALARHGDTLYIGGDFLTVHGQPQANFAAVDLRTAASIGPMPSVDGTVGSLALTPDGVLLGGAFAQVGDSARAGLARVDAAGRVMPWNAHLGDALAPSSIYFGVWALAIDGNRVYVGGQFQQVGTATRNGLGVVDLDSGDVLDWDAGLRSSRGDVLVRTLSLVPPLLYVGGSFTSVGAEVRSCLAAVDVRTARATSWDPRANADVAALSTDEKVVYAGGAFTSMGDWQRRRGLAGIDLRTGRVTSWDPNPEAYPYVFGIVPVGDRIYVGGAFDRIDGVPRLGIAAIDSATGQTTAWDAGCDGYIYSMVRSGRRLYVGGAFNAMGGLPRRNLAAIDLDDGSVTAWNPDANAEVFALAAQGDRIYAGGYLTGLGGQWRSYCGAMDTDGVVLSWDPQSDGFVLSLTATDSTVYAAGGFHNIGGQPRHLLASLSAATAEATPWDPEPEGTQTVSQTRVWSLAISDSTLYVGGDFSTIGGAPAAGLSAFSLAGDLLPWQPNVNGVVWSLLAEPDATYLGGYFSSVEGIPHMSLAALQPVSVVPPREAPGALELAQSAPNPAATATTIRFRLAEPATVTLTVYDLQGRLKTRLLDGVAFAAGVHPVDVATGSWPAGCYFYRVEAAGQTATRKMLVLR